MPFLSYELRTVQEDGDICECAITPFTRLLSYNSAPVLTFKRAKPATKREMTQFHSDEYVDFLSRITPSNMNQFIKEQHKCERVTPASRHICLNTVHNL